MPAMSKPSLIRGLRAAVAGIALAAMASSAGAATRPAGPTATGATLVAGGLDFPAAFTFAPDGRVFYGERFTGEIRIRDLSTGSDTLFATIPNLAHSGEQGLLGIALHPRYPAVPLLYAYATRLVGTQRQNQIIAVLDLGGVGRLLRVIFRSDTTAGTYHDGGRIRFGPDGMLYAMVGEAHDPSNAQDLSNDAGKVLRMTPAGTVPPDNPFPGSVAFSYGHRNSFGFTFDPLTRVLWETENGPECNDEINTVFPGMNYGWGPNETCSTPPSPPVNTNQDGPDPQLPLVWYTPTIAPTGAAFCFGCGLPGAQGNLFFGAVNTGEIRRVKLTGDRLGIASQVVAYDHPSGILSMEVGPGGAIYFSDDSGIWKLVSV
jgi:glucose/arabinose dehydrogenase